MIYFNYIVMKIFVVEIKDSDSVKQSGFSGSFISAHLHADSDTRKKDPKSKFVLVFLTVIDNAFFTYL